jgi:hypothetical protein
MPIDTKMNPNGVETTTVIPTGAKPIFFYPSVAQAQREYQFVERERECDGIRVLGVCVGIEREYTWESNYWAFYRSGIRIKNGVIECGWITVEHGCNWTYLKEKDFLGIGIGGDSGAGGTWPYQNETLNLVDTPVIIAEGVRFE